MPPRPSDLPDFDNPPLNELYMSIQFEPLPIDISGLVMIWHDVFRNEYPRLEARPSAPSSIETFSRQPTLSQTFQMNITNGPPDVRFWMITENDSELLQIQNDVFIRNWRLRPAVGEYPRYEALRERFERDTDLFHGCLAKSQLNCQINQCEIAYTNVLRSVPGDKKDLNRRLGELIKGFSSQLTIASCDLESVAMNLAWVDRSETDEYPPARLRAQINPAYTPEGEHAFRFILRYRGAPATNDKDGIMNFMDRGRSRIVNAFTEMTTESMHKIWGRTR